MDSERYIELLHNIHRHDNIFIQPEYRQDEKGFILTVMDKLNYLNDQDTYISEQSAIEKDMNDFGLKNDNESNDTDQIFLPFIFKELRIRSLYINQKGIARMKLRTLLSKLGYQKRSKKIIRDIYDCLLFYHIETSLKGNIPCSVETVDIDDMLTFKAV